ncbi:AAA family ATPase [Steroidobacter sp. S1-65]|uniref:AAA family ATPase n=1 Tax=Steroidobacter gossypii TaxID=2805490 RepID=A0ABS1WX20_9GAMM|nr:AAA family ATPase [Steroidobacter gossypii]MBM0105513.1 AAA family ATPase [Steroidobacter gossypii]
MTASDLSVLPISIGFGLATEPFADTADEAFFFPSDQHLRALEFMGHSLWTRSRLGVVTADHGCGKSLLIKRLLKDLDERVTVASVQREHIGPREFLLEILRQFGFALGDDDKTDRRRLLERFLAHQAGTGRLCLLIVENAQSMHPSVLEELRCLAAIEHDGVRVLKMLLLGQPALNLVLESPRMVELMSGNVSRFSLSAFSEDQTAAYVAHRLRAAGAPNPDALMPSVLLPQIHACSLGVPANINKLCTRAFVHAREEGASLVTESALDKAIEDLGWMRRRLRLENAVLEQVASLGSSPSQGKLVITMQGEPEREVLLKSDRMLVGRGEEADVRIDSVFISRYHALIVRDGNRDLLLDLGSTNGLLVNSRRILRRALRHRDLIQVGPARVMYINEQANSVQPDSGETLLLARPGLPAAAGDEEPSTLLAFGRLDPSA